MKSDTILLLTICLFIFLILLIEVLFSDMNIYTVSILLLCCIVVSIEYVLLRKRTSMDNNEDEVLIKD